MKVLRSLLTYLSATKSSKECVCALKLERFLQLLSDRTVKVYVIVLRYLAKLRRYWSQNAATRIAKAFVTNIEDELETLQLDIRKADNETCRAFDLFEARQTIDSSNMTIETLRQLLAEATAPVIRVAKNISESHDTWSNQQRREVLQWLSTVPSESQHQETVRRIVKGTGQWLLRHPELLEWQRSSSSEISWLHGGPGAGKSKLTSIMIESFLEQQKPAGGSSPPLAYFYCSNRGADARSRDPLEILKSLLRQLTGRHFTMPLRGSVGAEFQRRKDLVDGTGAQVSPLSLEQVLRHILDIAMEEPMILVIDALDEVEEIRRGELLMSLERILEAPNVVKTFVSSREDDDIVASLKQYRNVSISESMTNQDMQLFITAKLEQAISMKRILRGKITSVMRKEIHEALSNKAQGMFRWVELSIENLSNFRRIAVERDVRSELGKSPPEITQQYQILYDNINEAASSTAAIARRTFAWMLAAQRALTVEEMISAVALDDDGFYHTDLDVPRLLDICRDLLTVTTIDSALGLKAFQMAHLSVREFLELLPDFSTENVHIVAVSRLLDLFDPRVALKREHESQEILKKYSTYLFEHAAMSQLALPESHVAPKMVQFLFNSNDDGASALWEWKCIFADFERRFIFPEESDLPDMSFHMKCIARPFGQLAHSGGLHIVFLHGLLSVLSVIESGGIVSWEWAFARNTHQKLELVAATIERKHAVAKWLLERDIYHPDNLESYSQTALRHAVLNHDDDMVSLLLEHGANPLAQVDEGISVTPWNCVFWARHGSDCFTIFKRMYDRIEVLYEQRPNSSLSMTFDWRFDGLVEALRADWTEASFFLIHRMAVDQLPKFLKPDDYFGLLGRPSSILQVAVRYSRVTIIEALLDHFVGCPPETYRTQKLVESTESTQQQSHINHLDHEGCSVLHYLLKEPHYSTARKDSEQIMQLLLERGVNSHVGNREGILSLHIAAATGSTKMLHRLLEEERLDLNAKDSRGATALHFASGGVHRSSEAIMYLMNRGQDPLQRDLNHWTCLHYAAAACNIAALWTLLEACLSTDTADWDVKRANTLEVIHRPCSLDPLRANERPFNCLNSQSLEGRSLLHVVGSKREYFQLPALSQKYVRRASD